MSDDIKKMIAEKMEELQNCTNCPFIPRVSDEIAQAIQEHLEKEGYVKWSNVQVTVTDRNNRNKLDAVINFVEIKD